MTDLATTSTTGTDVIKATPATGNVLRYLACGLLGGLALGVAARGWMRLISDKPEFTWNGSLFIVVGFTIFGLSQSIVAFVRTRTSRRWKLTIVRAIGTIGILPLFVAAGGIMAPTVIVGGLAASRTDWRRGTRVMCALVAVIPVMFVTRTLLDKFGWSLRTLAGSLSLVVIYGVIVLAATFTLTAQDDGWHPPRRAKVVAVVTVSVPFAVLAFGVGFK